jgi:flavin reductase (DIM6/NTAB) family NADH-FMN oxidoreductase RutF
VTELPAAALIGDAAPATIGEVDGAQLRGFMRSWATGVSIVTTAAEDRPVGCTVNALTSVSLDPPLLLVALAGTSRTLAAVAERGVFAVNLLGSAQLGLVRRFTRATGDRFLNIRYAWRCGVPILDDTLAASVCTVTGVVPAGDHDLVLGRPCWLRLPDAATSAPAVFYAGEYGRLSNLGTPGADRRGSRCPPP